MSMHPLFQLITDNFREIPEKIAGAREPKSDDLICHCDACENGRPDCALAKFLRNPQGSYKPTQAELEAGERFDDKLAMYRGEY